LRDDYPVEVPVPQAKANSGSILSEVCFFQSTSPVWEDVKKSIFSVRVILSRKTSRQDAF
jgi:hypothetical protein